MAAGMPTGVSDFLAKRLQHVDRRFRASANATRSTAVTRSIYARSFPFGRNTRGAFLYTLFVEPPTQLAREVS